MKLLVNISRIIVGVLFIFSGLVKANDPLGLSYKMQEFFEVWGNHASLHGVMLWLNNYALPFSIITITLEILVGVGILIGWRPKFFSWVLLLLITFFTFLTGYAVLSGKIKTCGCFGDCIPLTAVQSFIKDILLFILIIFIVIGTKYIRPLFQPKISFFVLLCSVAFTLVLQRYVLHHLPIVDCLPFKIGNNLLELGKMPANAVPDKIEFTFVYQKNNEQKEFTKDELPDSTWTFLSRKDVIIERGSNNVPPINDFFLTTLSGADTTEAVLNTPSEYYLFFIKDASHHKRAVKRMKELLPFARQKNRTILVVASQTEEANRMMNEKNYFNVTVLGCDATALKTAARTDPTLYLMKGPVVVNKWGRADFDKAVQ